MKMFAVKNPEGAIFTTKLFSSVEDVHSNYHGGFYALAEEGWKIVPVNVEITIEEQSVEDDAILKDYFNIAKDGQPKDKGTYLCKYSKGGENTFTRYWDGNKWWYWEGSAHATVFGTGMVGSNEYYKPVN